MPSVSPSPQAPLTLPLGAALMHWPKGAYAVLKNPGRQLCSRLSRHGDHVIPCILSSWFKADFIVSPKRATAEQCWCSVSSSMWASRVQPELSCVVIRVWGWGTGGLKTPYRLSLSSKQAAENPVRGSQSQHASSSYPATFPSVSHTNPLMHLPPTRHPIRNTRPSRSALVFCVTVSRDLWVRE